MLTVTYLSDFPKEWSLGLDQCKNLPRLREFGLHWGGVCTDAWDVIRKMNEQDFSLFRYGLAKERKGHYAGDAWFGQFGAILMPELLFRVSMIAEQFSAPWGLAWMRCEQAGLIRRDGDVYIWTGKEQQE